MKRKKYKLSNYNLLEGQHEVNPGKVYPDDNPGSQFKTALDKKTNEKMIKNLQKTLDWFEMDVFPAIENNKWPVNTNNGPYTLYELEIPEGEEFNSIDSEIRIYWGGGAGSYHTYTLEELWNIFEEDVVGAPDEVRSAIGLTSDAGIPKPTKRNINENLSRGSLYRKKYYGRY
jgi:hypothetical protein